MVSCICLRTHCYGHVIRHDDGSTSSETASTIPVEEAEPKEEDVEVVEMATAAPEEEDFQNERLPISEGKRAMTIAVADDQGVAGFIKQGSFVDVVTIMTAPEDSKKEQHDAATLLLQNVKVLAVGHAADDEETNKRYQMVTIEVSPEQGLILSFATQYDLHLLLRQEGDDVLESDKTHVHEDDLHKGVFK